MSRPIYCGRSRARDLAPACATDRRGAVAYRRAVVLPPKFLCHRRTFRTGTPQSVEKHRPEPEDAEGEELEKVR